MLGPKGPSQDASKGLSWGVLVSITIYADWRFIFIFNFNSCRIRSMLRIMIMHDHCRPLGIWVSAVVNLAKAFDRTQRMHWSGTQLSILQCSVPHLTGTESRACCLGGTSPACCLLIRLSATLERAGKQVSPTVWLELQTLPCSLLAGILADEHSSRPCSCKWSCIAVKGLIHSAPTAEVSSVHPSSVHAVQ